MTKLLLIALVGCGGGAASDDPISENDSSRPTAVERATAVDAAAPPDAAPPDAAPVRMLSGDQDPWGPNAPRPPDSPRSKRPPRDAGEMPEPADREVVLRWDDRPRVRVHLPIGNWYENRPIVLSGSRFFTDIKFHPAWGEGNIDLVLDLGCQGSCSVERLPANIVQRARDDFAAMRRSDLKSRWIVKPHGAGGTWSWRFEATDDVGTRTDGRVAVYRVIPELGAFLECRGETTRRANPIWLDRIEALCRELTFEVLP